MDYNPEDLRVDTFHAHEQGGFVHTNHTAVRITHLPTGAYVESKTERSLHRNKQHCMELLPAAIKTKTAQATSSRAEQLIACLEAEIVKRDALVAELEAALNQAHMALVGYLPGHRNAVTTAAIESARALLAQGVK